MRLQIKYDMLKISACYKLSQKMLDMLYLAFKI